MTREIREWTVHHIKQKDALKRDLVSFKELEDRIVCEHKETHANYYCWEHLDMERLKKVPENEVAYFVCSCNEHNFKLLVDHWDYFKTRQGWTFIFLNTTVGEKWIIKPFIHAKIADPATLKQGLRTMYDVCLGKGE